MGRFLRSANCLTKISIFAVHHHNNSLRWLVGANQFHMGSPANLELSKTPRHLDQAQTCLCVSSVVRHSWNSQWHLWNLRNCEEVYSEMVIFCKMPSLCLLPVLLGVVLSFQFDNNSKVESIRLQWKKNWFCKLSYLDFIGCPRLSPHRRRRQGLVWTVVASAPRHL